MAARESSYRCCFVPKCKSTSVTTPGKLFFYLPSNESLRKRWCNAARREGPVVHHTRSCCEDHFDLEADMANHVAYKLMGHQQVNVRLKADVVPHKFDCQGKQSVANVNRLASKRKREVRSMLASKENTPAPQRRKRSQTSETSDLQAEACPLTDSASTADVCLPSTSAVVIQGTGASRVLCDSGTQTEASVLQDGETQTKVRLLQDGEAQTDRHAVHQRSVQTERQRGTRRHRDTQTDHWDQAAATRRWLAGAACSRQAADRADDEYQPSDSESDSDGHEEVLNLMALDVTRGRLRQEPLRYTGVPEPFFSGIVDRLASELGYQDRGQGLTKADVVCLVLVKVRLDLSNCILADMFGIGTSTASRLIAQYLPVIGECLRGLVVWPEKERIRAQLPTAFKAYYYDCESLIDCFEIQIAKPSSAMSQTMSWSEYKKNNTLKYLISATPDGFINFISRGRPGRTSDIEMLRMSGYLQCVRPGSTILADRGFKELESDLAEVGCRLVRPPSVQKDQQLSRAEVRKMRSIAGLRIHIERVIGRLRVFRMIDIHASMPVNTVDLADSAVWVACGLANLHKRIVKMS